MNYKVRNSTYCVILSVVLLAGLWWGGRQSLPGASVRGPGTLLINEFLAANQAGITDADGDHSDWIEIYNPGPRAINLAGWSLTDDPQEPLKWTFPHVTLGGHEYRLVFASGKNLKSTQPGSEWHTSFRIDRDGEFLGLYDLSSSRFVETPAWPARNEFPEQFRDVSYGCRRRPQEGAKAGSPACGYLSTPTPGQPNAETLLWAGLVAPVDFGRERGFYRAPLTLDLSTPTPGATIRYTTDGSEPTETHGRVYGEPIQIATTTIVRAAAYKPGFRTSPVGTHTYLFVHQVLTQPASPPGFGATWGAYESAPALADYEMDPEVVSDPRYSGALEPALRSIATLSIVADRQSFHELHANPRQKGRDWERPVSVEYMVSDPRRGFQINAGLRIQGELGRLEVIPKHGFRLFFRDEYGAAKLEVPLFPGSTVREFDTLVLRSGVNRSYAGWPDSDQKPTTYTRDQWLRDSQIAMTGSGSHGIFVHLYLNGLYWGLYNVVERPDESFLSSYYGGSKDDWQAISHGEALVPSSERFEALHRLAAAGQLEDPVRYAAIQELLDISHLIDYLVLNWYAGNLDWAFNNWYAGVRRTSGQVRYFCWDGERTWMNGAEIYMGMDEYNGQPNLIKPLFEALLENPDFRMVLADRLYKHLHNDGALTDVRSRARWVELNQAIEGAIVGESARWGDTRKESPITQEHWFRARDDVLAQMQGNAAKLIALAREAGYYPPIDPPAFDPHGGEIEPGFQLRMSVPSPQASMIYYTTDGSDPRQSGTGMVSPNARRYTGPWVLTSTIQVKARAFSQAASTSLEGRAWSALNEAILPSATR